MVVKDSRAVTLEATIMAIQRQWGPTALRRLSEAAGRSAAWLSLGMPALDPILPGLPVGHITEILGAATSGKRTLTYHIIAAAQAAHAICLYIDLQETFDPMQAAYHQVDVEKLILMRPVSLVEAFTLAYELLTRCQITLLVVDAASPTNFDSVTARAVRRLIAPLGQQKSTLLLLTETPNPIDFQCQQAVLQLAIQRQRWLEAGLNITGYQTRITVVRNKLGYSGQSALMTIEVGQT